MILWAGTVYHWWKGFPHTSGDDPSLSKEEYDLLMFSPHKWGWSVRSHLVRSGLHVFPTQVGMILLCVSHSKCHISFPHTSGDDPSRKRCREKWISFSPHKWGWSFYCKKVSEWMRVFPTQVGMILGRYDLLWFLCSFPHTSGDDPSTISWWCFWSPFSPHKWGWSQVRCYENWLDRVFPTQVGMILYVSIEFADISCFPHTSGDDPYSSSNPCHTLSFSPHKWGWSFQKH